MRRFSSLNGKNALCLKDNMGLSREEEGEGGRGERDVIMVFVCLNIFCPKWLSHYRQWGGW